MQRRLTIREAERRDLKRIVEIEVASFGRDAWDEHTLSELLSECPALFIVCKLRGRIAGYAVTCVDDRRAELVSIAVAPAARRQGVGEAMMHFMLDALRRRGTDSWRLMVRIENYDAIRFYRDFGFVRTRTVKRYYGPRSDAWRMALSIGPVGKSVS